MISGLQLCLKRFVEFWFSLWESLVVLFLFDVGRIDRISCCNSWIEY